MAKNTSILLGDHFDNVITKQIENGRYSSASEVVRAALRLFEQEEVQKTELIHELIKGEESGFIPNFDSDKFLKKLQNKFAKNGL